jgi:2-phospho-L-lactate/phosphoenolpyruvate guanylyltransferase
MTARAILVMKGKSGRKSRLAPMMSPAERDALVAHMLDHAVAMLAASPAIGEIMLVSPEREDVALPVTWVPDPGAGLNAAILAGTWGAGDVLVLLPDLPLLSVEDIDALAAAGAASRIAIAPDHGETGTNALYLAAGQDFRFAFGAGSLAAHRAEARRLGIEPALIRRRGLAVDVDEPEDVVRAFGRAIPFAA